MSALTLQVGCGPEAFGDDHSAAQFAATAVSNGLTTSAAVSSTTLVPGATETITASVRSDTSRIVLVDIEVYTPAGKRIAQRFFDKQSFTAGVSRNFTMTWSAPSAAVMGLHTIKVGIFTAGWAQMIHWNNSAATFSVAAVIDAGAANDAGVPVVDAGAASDAGASFADAGGGTPDAGATAQDAGTVLDAGVPTLDAGSTFDAGAPKVDAGVPSIDAGSAPDAGAVADAGVRPSEWLYTQGNKIRKSDGTVWHGRGANIFDTRQCNTCAYQAPSVDAVKFRINELVDSWKANFLRLDLESYASADGRTHYQGVLQDAAYLRDLQEIVRHAASKPGVYVLVSLWIDPSFNSQGWPTDATIPVWEKLAEAFRDQPRVLFGISNEPQSNSSGAQDAQVWTAMNKVAQAIRAVEDRVSPSNHHIIVAQGTRDWARVLTYYVTHPLTAGDGKNFAYETHVYDPASEFAKLFEIPSQTIPVIIGEFGAGTMMTLPDCVELMRRAEAAEVPYTGWALHSKCAPGLVTTAVGSCSASGTFVLTEWGQALKNRFATPW
jgi:endoglucanase